MPEAPRRALAAAALLALLAPGGAGAGDAVPPGRAADLERLVRQDCGSCHGMRLSGGLGPDIRAEALSEIPAETVTAIILDGLPGTAMPPWRPLITREEAQWIAAYLKSAE
jgi:cytochrome c55X